MLSISSGTCFLLSEEISQILSLRSNETFSRLSRPNGRFSNEISIGVVELCTYWWMGYARPILLPSYPSGRIGSVGVTQL